LSAPSQALGTRTRERRHCRNETCRAGRKRLLLFASGLYLESSVGQLVCMLCQEYDSLVICMHTDLADNRGRMPEGMDVTVFRKPYWRNYGWLRRLIRQENIGAVWCYNLPPLFHSIPATLFTGARLVMNFMGGDIQYNKRLDYGFRKSWSRNLVFHALMRFPSRFVCMSPFIEELARSAHIPQRKIAVIPNMFHIEQEFAPASDREVADLRRALGLRDERLVVSVGRHAATKRMDQLIRAAQVVRGRRGDVCFLVVGTGERIEENRNLARELDLVNTLRFVEHIPRGQLRLYYAAGDVSCNVSDKDAFCNPVIEAMTQGTPVVVGPNVGAGRYLTGEPFCQVVNPGDVHSIADGICRMLDGDVKRTHASAAIARAREFDVSRVFPLWRALFDEMLAS